MVFRLLGMIVAACLAFAGSAQAQGKTEVLWYSQAAFKITTPGGKVIMIDPWIMGATKIPPELKDLSKIGKVDVILGEARVLKRPLRHLGVDLRERDIRREPRRMLVDAGNIGLALDAHRRAISLVNVAPHRRRMRLTEKRLLSS